jgi:hypothetical protein
MAAPATPRRGLFGRLVGSISQFVATPRQTTPPANESPPETQTASVLSPAATPAESPKTPPAPEQWYPGMIQSKYLQEMENMFDDISKTPQRRPLRRPQTCPPKRRNTRANMVEMPRSAMKKRSAPIDDDEPITPSNTKRVKFNETLVQERIISPAQSGERDLVPDHRFTCSKKRPRATDPYTGKHFADSPNIFDDESPSKRARYEAGEESTCDTENTPITQTNTNMNAGIRDHDAEVFVPNRTQPRPGTFELNYDTYGQGDDYSGLSEEGDNEQTEAEPTPTYNPPSANTIPGRFALDFSDESLQFGSSTQSLPNDTTPTPGPSQPTITSNSSPPPPPLEPSTTNTAHQQTTHPATPDSDTSPPTPPMRILPDAAETKARIEKEVDDLPWPAPVTYVEAGIASQEIIDLVKERYDEEDDYYAQVWWDREYSKFTDALATAKAQGRELVVEF